MSTMPPAQSLDLVAENAELRARLAEAEDMLRAIRRGEIDALVMQSDTGPRVYTLQGVDSASNRARGEMLEIISDAVIAVDSDQRVTYVNPAARQLFSLDESAALGKPTSEIPELRVLNVLITENSMLNSEWHGEAADWGRDSQRRHLEATLMPRQQDCDGSAGILATFRDISSRKQAEEGLRENEEFNRSLMEGSVDCVKVLDVDGRLLQMNGPGLCLMEIDDFKPLCGQKWSAVWPAAAGQDIECAVAAARRGDTYSFQAFCPTAKATPRWWDVIVSPVRNGANGPVVRLLSVSRDITGQKQAEEERTKIAERVRLATEAAQLGFWSWQPDEDIVEWENEYPRRILGMEPSEPSIGSARFAAEFVVPEDLAALEQAMARTVQAGEPLAFTGRIRRRDGETRWVEIEGRWAPPGGSRAPHITGTIQDITDRKKAEAKLRTSEIRYRRLFEAAHDGILILDPDTRKIIAANPFMTELLGYAPGQLIGMELFEIGFLADASASRAMFQTLKATRQERYENLPLKSRAGELREVEVVANLYDEDGRSVVQCNIRDITERKKVEEASARLAAIVTSSADAIIGKTLDGTVTSWNEGAERLFGYTREEMIGHSICRIIPADRQNEDDTFRVRIRAGDVIKRYETIRRHKDGQPIEVSVTLSPIRNTAGDVVGASKICRDITERRRAETESRERQHFLNRIFEVLPGVLYIFDLDENRIVFSNQGPVNVPYSPVEVAAMGADFVGNLMHPDDQLRFQEHIVRLQTLDPGATEAFEYRMRDKADEWRWYINTDTVFLRNESGVARQFLGVALEITDRKHAEFALRESEARQHQVLTASRIGTFDVDLVSGEGIWNPTEFELLGLRPGEAPPGSATFFRHVHPEDLDGLQVNWEAAVQSGQLDTEFRIIRADGETRWLAARGDMLYDQPGDDPLRVRRYLGVNFDITERKEQEEHLRFLMKEVNHRSKNMLALVQAVARQTATASPQDFVTRFGERIQSLAAAQDLLVKSQWQAVSLSELIRSQLAHFKDLIGDRIQLQGPDVKILPAAAQTIGMAVHELATNAGKYGALFNEIGRVEVTWNLLGPEGGGPQFLMSWTESGGPPVTKPTRRGFGSRVIGSMVKMSLDCDSEIDYAPTGFGWRIACPAEKIVEKAAAAKSRPAPRSVHARATGLNRVLVVEDEALIAIEIEAILSDAGFTVVGPVGSVAHALALIERSGCEAAVLDINLGDDTAEPIARVLSARATPFVTISGYSREQQPAAFRNAPLVSKPVRPELLVAEIRKCLDKAY